MNFFDKLLRESALMLRSLAKRLDREEPGDESIVLEPSIPYWHQHMYAKRPEAQPPQAPWEKEPAVERLGRKSPLLFPENRRAIERVLAGRGVKSDDTIDSLLKESRR
jgi:hypothetical protein